MKLDRFGDELELNQVSVMKTMSGFSFSIRIESSCSLLQLREVAFVHKHLIGRWVGYADECMAVEEDKGPESKVGLWLRSRFGLVVESG